MEEKNKQNMTQLQDFDPHRLPEHFAMILVGPNEKMNIRLLGRMLLTLTNRYDNVYMFSSKSDLKQYEFIPLENLYFNDEIGKLVEILEIQQKTIRANHKKNKKDRVLNPLIIVDSLNDLYIMKQLFLMSRNLSINVISLVQSRTGIGPMVRENVDCVMCLNVTNEDRKMLCREYLSSSDLGYKEGEAFFKSVTKEPYTALAIIPYVPGQREVYQRGFRYNIYSPYPYNDSLIIASIARKHPCNN